MLETGGPLFTKRKFLLSNAFGKCAYSPESLALEAAEAPALDEPTDCPSPNLPSHFAKKSSIVDNTCDHRRYSSA